MSPALCPLAPIAGTSPPTSQDKEEYNTQAFKADSCARGRRGQKIYLNPNCISRMVRADVIFPKVED
jgi:hypothetical protein